MRCTASTPGARSATCSAEPPLRRQHGLRSSPQAGRRPQRARAQADRAAGARDQRPRAGDRGAERRGTARAHGRLPRAAARRRAARRHARGGAGRRPRGGPPPRRRARLRRAAHRRGRAASRQRRRDADGRGQDAGRHAGALRERPRGQGRAPGHGQRLPRRARAAVVRTGARRAGAEPGRDPERGRLHLLARAGLGTAGARAPAVRPASRGLPGGRDLRDQQRVRLRLPARQHGAGGRAAGAAQPPLRDRRRGRLGADRRGADAADHLRPAAGRPLALPALQRAGAAPAARRALHRGGAHALRAPHRGGHRGPRARAGNRQHLLAGALPADALHGGGAEGAHHLPARPRVRGQGRPRRDRRRVHGPPDGGAPLVRRAAPGRRGQGGRQDSAGVRDLRDDHAPELLPPLREARRHDRHRRHRRRGVARDLRPRGDRRADQPADGPRRLRGPRVPQPAREVRGGDRRRDGSATPRTARSSLAPSRSRTPSSSPTCCGGAAWSTRC